jgi:hypothetical protein
MKVTVTLLTIIPFSIALTSCASHSYKNTGLFYPYDSLSSEYCPDTFDMGAQDKYDGTNLSTISFPVFSELNSGNDLIRQPMTDNRWTPDKYDGTNLDTTSFPVPAELNFDNNLFRQPATDIADRLKNVMKIK